MGQEGRDANLCRAPSSCQELATESGPFVHILSFIVATLCEVGAAFPFSQQRELRYRGCSDPFKRRQLG